MKKSLLSFMLLGSVFMLSACETWMDQQLSNSNTQINASSKGILSPLPPALKTDDTQNLPRYGEAINVMNMNHTAPMPSVQTVFGYGAGVPVGDPSVTIFPLDGAAPTYGGSPDAPQIPFNNDFMNTPINSAPFMHGAGGVEGQIFFKHGSSRLGSGDINQLSNVAEQAKFAPVNRITIEGYASQPTQAGSQSVEGHILNLKESMNRSFAVSKKLMQKGVPAEKIKTVSWGATKSSGNESQDRRVDIVMGER